MQQDRRLHWPDEYYIIRAMEAERASENQLSEPYSAECLKQRLQLQGECRIESFSFLEFSWAKSILLFSLLLVSVVGLLLLKYYKGLRAAVFYRSSPMYEAATHVFIRANGRRQEEIVRLERAGTDIFFYYKKLKYEYFEGKCYPVGLDLEPYLRDHFNQHFIAQGLSSEAAERGAALFGRNEHIVDPPAYFQYLYEVMTEPFFFVQYMAAVIYVIEKMPELSVLLIGASIVTTSINYVILYVSYRKIKQIAEVVLTLSVLRDGAFLELPSSELVPGDIFIPREELSCDVLLLKGELYVNEANLTGESIPIGKFGVGEHKNYQQGSNSQWIYEGSKILSASNPLAMVVRTGYSSKKGRILRKILHRSPESPHFFTTFIVFMFEVYAAGVLAYLGTMSLRVNSGQLEPIIIFLDFLLIITFCFPPSGPIYFNLVYSFALVRLKANNVLGTEPEKTVDGAHLALVCFDKTGTLTEDKVQVRRVLRFAERAFEEIGPQSHGQSLDFRLFACCHTVKEFEGRLMGDEIDLKLFLHSGFSLCPSKEAATCFEVEQQATPSRLQILKIYQYESKFQSMSVLAYDTQSSKYYVFAKGAPEVIHKFSTAKFAYFDRLLQTESYSGFRTIGYGYKQVEPLRLGEHMRASREEHLSQIRMLGLVSFENKLKQDARETIHRLELAGIKSRMITGDNVYIAIETAVRCGILERKDEVVVLQGSNSDLGRHSADIKFNAKVFHFEREEVVVSSAVLSYQEYLSSSRPIVVDNDFLRLREGLRLSPMIRVYSRVSPENKALIVGKLREEIAGNRQQLGWLQRMCRREEEKVAMVGDGANDLLAIKEANIGIGIRNCDSSYAASFSVENLLDIDYIVREAKCSEREIVEICRFMCVGGLLTVPCLIIMQTEAAFYSTFQLIFDNFTKYLLFPILLALSRPASASTPHKPSSNFLRGQNQLVFWGNVVISTLAIAATLIYYRSTSEYVYNYSKATLDSGWASNNSLVASQFLYYSLQPVILVFCIYEGAPWKEPIYCNLPLLIVLLLNLAFQIGCYFFQAPAAAFFSLPVISSTAALYLFIIGAVASILALLWSRVVGALQLHEEEQSSLGSKEMVELAQTGALRPDLLYNFLLMKLKYSFNRSYQLALLLIHIQETSILGVLLVAAFTPFYQQLFETIDFRAPFHTNFSITILALNLLILAFTAAPNWTRFSFLRPAWSFAGIALKLFPYLFSTPLLTYSLGSAQQGDLLGRAAGITNVLFVLAYLLLHQFLNESLKFTVADFCNRRLTSYPEQLIIVLCVASVKVMGAFYGCLIYLVRAAFVLARLYGNFEYQLVQRMQLFYALLSGYVALAVLACKLELVDSATLEPVANSLLLLAAGAAVSWVSSRQLGLHIGQRLLRMAQWGGQRGEGEFSSEEQHQMHNFENEIKSLVQVILEKWKWEQGRPNDYEHYWKVFNERVFVHKLRCEQKRCYCKSKKHKEKEVDEEVYVYDILKRVQGVGAVLGKQGRLKVLNINLLVEIAKKPLKGYYQLISLKREKNKLSVRLEIEELVLRARECFDQIYYKNKVQNQQLDLMKSIECEEVMTALEEELKAAMAQTISFLEIFTYSTVKMAQVQQESLRLFEAKRSIEAKLERMTWQVGESGAVGLALFVFYRMLEVYRSRENELKKLGGQQSLKKRLMQKAEGETVAEEQGIIYIDLVEERGRIKKITLAISEFFGYSKEDMIGFNINLFMPSLFGKCHAKFLSNFIDKGRIKLLKERTRVVFGKNKKKFIFPINIKLKTEHLQHDQFGASALISRIDTSSEFLIAGVHARLEEISEGLYRRVLYRSLREEVSKANKLCLYKLIPGLNQVVDNWEEKHSSKIHEGLLVFSDSDAYLMEKFRYSRESSYSSISNKTKTLNLSMTSISSNSLPVDSRSERFEYFSELFKTFLIDINPAMLKALKISYKYSRIRTSEFEVELVEIINMRDQLEGKEFLRELLNEFSNVAEIYQLLEEHSPLARHLSQLEEQVELGKLVGRRSSKELTLALGAETDKKDFKNSYNRTNKDISLNDGCSEQSFEDDASEDKRLFNPQMSEQSSLVGNTESESKKQLLINAFNSNESALPRAAVFAAYLALFVLLVLLVLLSYFSYKKINEDHLLWNDASFLLDIRTIVEFRLSLIEVQTFTQALNLSLPTSLLARTTDLNSQMVTLLERMNALTENESPGGFYAYVVPLWDPVRNITYAATLPQLLSQITWLFQQAERGNVQLLRENYENIHLSLQRFYGIREENLRASNAEDLQRIKYFFGFYESLLIVTAFCSLPLYIYFKREELTVRSKLAFMSVKEIRKAIGRLRVAYDFLRKTYKKGAVSKLQIELNDRRGEKEEEAGSASKSIKITSEAEESKLFKNPVLYLLLLAFVAFFSNISVTLFVLSARSDSSFAQAVVANRLINDMLIKTPLLLNTYLANLNNALSGVSQRNFSSSLLAEAETGYYSVVGTLSHPTYASNSLASSIEAGATELLCRYVNCTASNFSLEFVANSNKHRFNYWAPANGIVPSEATINSWVRENGVGELLGQVEYVLLLSSVIREFVERQFGSELSGLQVLFKILIGVFVPVNLLVMLVISRRFLSLLNGIIKSAEEIFMHFPVSVLVENTYLTSYFNSKAKHGK